MKKLILYITLFMTIGICKLYGQKHSPKELGIGFAIATNPYQFEDLSIPATLYRDKEMAEKWDSDKVFPFFFKPEYGLYHFICLEKTDNFYKILVNDKEIGYLPNDSGFHFISWNAILLQSTVERLSKENLIRKEPKNNSGIVLNDCELDRLMVNEVIEKNGEYWLQIYFSPKCENYPEKNSNVTYGWIRWRTQDKLLVKILLLC